MMDRINMLFFFFSKMIISVIRKIGHDKVKGKKAIVNLLFLNKNRFFHVKNVIKR